MSRDWSRRRLLVTSGAVFGGGLAGCLSDNGDSSAPDTETAEPDTTTNAPATTQEATVDASIGAKSRYDEDLTLTVEVRRDGNQVLQKTETVLGNMNQRLGIEVETPGNYVVIASLEGGAEARYDWQVDAGYDGNLDVRIAADGSMTIRESFSDESCTSEGVPYVVPGNQETLSKGDGHIQNYSGSTVEVAFSIAHDDTVFFDCTYTLEAGQSVSLGALTSTVGEYTVMVDVDGGGRTEYDWKIPSDHAWPTLVVHIPADSDPLVGCSGGFPHEIDVRNPTDYAQEVTLTLARDGENFVQQTTSVEANAETTVTLTTPIGGIYTLRATTDADSEEAEFVDCNCYRQDRTTVTLYAVSPSIESRLLVCD